ncbi:similar to Saccharomyces cerevisiae YOR093C Putative protein of unknown function [Maudiozyma barnettii]|uniref:DMAP1-binding domain-containing protein n=1 Tax=Maudiozyma barnettii TaxID=61262 RepID=A0A8H2VFH6_9SACH|nr:Cmr2p [Kazachstania barnettii]CAB4254233.1 similar to Saccharomyces cerevisiae YOR093C Putative protein of unknown function [Kazachstania barnettii]CAD1781977.1 similar to Saccharomyces cerevisiae YOR093C Putative protein of unknown function [Kazachstania barnettii]
MDFSIPPYLPAEVQERLNEMINDYKEENLTKKGYEIKRKRLLEKNSHIGTPSIKEKKSVSNIRKNTIRIPGRNQSLSSTMNISKYAGTIPDNVSMASSSRSHRDTGSDPASSIYKVTTVNSTPNGVSPLKRHGRNYSTQLSLASFDPLAENSVYNPMIPLLQRDDIIKTDLTTKYKDYNIRSLSLPQILRGRFEVLGNENALITVDAKGKENFISWDKLYLRAEKVAHEMTKKKLYKNEKVILWYNKDEIIEFSVALLGCFIAGMVAIPASFEAYTLGEIMEIIKLTSSKFILISNECHKQVNNLYSTNNNTKIKLLKNDFFDTVTFLKTDDLGTYSKAKKGAPTFDTPYIAYIEFTRTPLGRLSGVMIKHETLLSQFKVLSEILDSRAMPDWKKVDIIKPYNVKHRLTSVNKRNLSRFTVMNTLDPTRSTGLIFGVLFNIFTGNLLISVNDQLINKPGGYENLINKYRADILLNDQLQLKQVVINYLENPEIIMAERKKTRIDFSCIKCCLTSCTTIDTDVTEMVVHKWLKNLGCIDAPLVYSPILSLLDFGGIIISTKDQLGGLENFPIHEPKLRLHDELFINREKLKENIIEASIPAMINSSSSFKDYLKVETFGFPIPNTLLCVVNPDNATLVPDLTVGEIWVSSIDLANEFFQLDKINAFVFNARLNFVKMQSYVSKNNSTSESLLRNAPEEKLETIMNLCPPETQFMRTKLMGFVFNGKVFILSLIEDMFLQNKLVRLSNWAHTSDTSKSRKDSNQHLNRMSSISPSIADSGNRSVISSPNHPKRSSDKRVVQTYYLQQISETLVRTVNTVYEVAAFELNHHKEEHFLVMVIESSLAKKKIASSELDPSNVVTVYKPDKVLEKKMNDLIDQLYRILWIFHKIKPMCMLVVPKGTLPRRYCSLEIANSTVEKKFISGELEAKFIKFQMDNIILDYIPHSSYYNESIFSEHLSKLRQLCVEEANTTNKVITLQDSGIDYRDISYDSRERKRKLTDFASIMDVLEWRIPTLKNKAAFSELGESFHSSSKMSDMMSLRSISWSNFEVIVASFLKKIVSSKTPLKSEDRIVILADNNIDYVAIVMACFYCNFVVIPLPPLSEENLEKDLVYLTEIIKTYKVKRIFIDMKVHTLLDTSPNNKIFKKYKHMMPKITLISKIKRKQGLSIKIFKKILSDTYHYKPGKKTLTVPRLVWISREFSSTKDIHVTMNHSTLMNACKVLKETLQLSADSSIFSLCSHTKGLGFILSSLIGIYVGSMTTLFSHDMVMANPKYFLMEVQNKNVRDLFLTLDSFTTLMDKASKLVNNVSRSNTNATRHHNKTSKKTSQTQISTIRGDMFRNVKNIMIPFIGRPEFNKIESILLSSQSIFVKRTQINYIYQHHFNPIISLHSYLDVPPVDFFADPTSLREGMVKEAAPGFQGLRLQDSGVVPVCTNVSIVNPETLLPCYEGEIGEIWCCSEANVFNYTISRDGKLVRDELISQQFKSRMTKGADNGLTYLRTGDLGFIRTVEITNSNGDLVRLNLLYVLGRINETIELLGLTHFVSDLERTVYAAHNNIKNCIISKAGGLLVCLIRCRPKCSELYANIAALVVSELLNRNGVIVDLCTFVKPNGPGSYVVDGEWKKNRSLIMNHWFSQKLLVETQFGVNYGENISMYLLSDFNKDTVN